MRWIIKPAPDTIKQQQLARELGIDQYLAGLLVQRGVDAFAKAKSYFRPAINELYDPFLMADMQLAVQRIDKAVINKENILVYGDYDVDGTTSVALMSLFLKSYYDRVTTYIPDRYTEGYGISYQGIDYAHDNDISLIIALDCGIKAIDQVTYAQDRGIDFIICDHHRPGDTLPNAAAVLDPKRSDCNYPFDELCGCGVGFKLCQALVAHYNWDPSLLIPYMDLVAIAIGADIVPIVDENRVLAYHGLHVINTSPRVGIKVIIDLLNKDTLSITDVVFNIAPRINAAGRMKHALHAVELLVTDDQQDAQKIAAQIEGFNTDRRAADQSITTQALELIESDGEQDRYSTVVYHHEWHKGVIGIVASRLIETYYRPTLVFTKSGDSLAASARSVSGFDVYNAIEQCAHLVQQFGGHKYAAGLTIDPDNYHNFKQSFEQVVADSIKPDQRLPKLTIDLELPLDHINAKLYRILKQMAPFGPKNMRPVFMTLQVCDSGNARCVGKNKEHLKIKVVDPMNKQVAFNAIGFNLGHKYDLVKSQQTFDIAYVIDQNVWNGITSLQLVIKDIK